jgi:hypothetical protein
VTRFASTPSTIKPLPPVAATSESRNEPIALTKSLSKMGRVFRSFAVITEESRFSSVEVRSTLVSALTTMLVAAGATAITMRVGEASLTVAGVETADVPGAEKLTAV